MYVPTIKAMRTVARNICNYAKNASLAPFDLLVPRLKQKEFSANFKAIKNSKLLQTSKAEVHNKGNNQSGTIYILSIA